MILSIPWMTWNINGLDIPFAYIDGWRIMAPHDFPVAMVYVVFAPGKQYEVTV